MSVRSVVEVGNFVRVHDDGPVRVVTMDRRRRHNALVPELIDDMRAAVAQTAADTEVRALVLAAEGRNFSTGGDVAEFATRTGADRVEYSRRIVGGLNALILDLMRLDIPVVAAVQGAVTGGSLGLVLAADVVLLSPDATFTPYYVDVGFSPDGGWTAILPDRIGQARALVIQLDNATIDAATAVEWGMAAAVVPGDVLRAAVEQAQRYAAKKPGSIAATKRQVRGDLTVLAERLETELENFVEQIGTDDAAAGMAAFLGRRRPDDANPGTP